MTTLEALEKKAWGEPTFGSHLVVTCHALRKKHLEDFTPENVRIMVGQSIGLKYLTPMALDLLEADLFAHGDFYPGDLLSALLRENNWPEIEPWSARIDAIAQKAIAWLQAAAERQAADDLDSMQRGFHPIGDMAERDLIKTITAWQTRPSIALPRKGKNPKRPRKGEGA